MSELYIKTEVQHGRTMVTDSFFTNPLKIAKSFYREDGYTEIMTMVVGPGMLRGDIYDICYDMSDDTKTLMTSQSYQKLHNSTGGETIQKVQINVGANAEFCFIPHPTIPFTGNTFSSNMNIELQPSSKFIFTDILSTGREGMGERLTFARFSSTVNVSVGGNPVFIDHTRLFTDETDFNKIGFYESRSSQGLMYFYGYYDLELHDDERVEAAVSKCREGYAVRMLCDSGDAAYTYAMKLWEKVRS